MCVSHCAASERSPRPLALSERSPPPSQPSLASAASIAMLTLHAATPRSPRRALHTRPAREQCALVAPAFGSYPTAATSPALLSQSPARAAPVAAIPAVAQSLDFCSRSVLYRPSLPKPPSRSLVTSIPLYGSHDRASRHSHTHTFNPLPDTL